MDFYKGNIPIIEDNGEGRDMLFLPHFAKGYVPRDYKEHPEEMFQHPDEMTLIPESEWDARYDEQEGLKSSLEHVYLSGPNGEPAFINLDQDGVGYCWNHSTTQATMLSRLERNMPLVRLNAFSIGAIVKKGRDEGGWCGLSAEFARTVGIAPEGTGPGQWPKWSRDYKKYDTPTMRAAMAKYKTTEDWVDLTRQVYDQNLTRQQVATSGFNNEAGARDYNYWSHSVCGVRWVRIERGNWGQLILNSWLNWGRYGLAVLQGSHAICNGAISIRTTTASAA